jgi:two-component system sensor kinase FixL
VCRVVGWVSGARARYRGERRNPRWGKLGLAAGYIALYLLLDKLSFVEAMHGIDITPWNPQPGLTLALLLLNGSGYIPAAVLAPLVSSQLLPASPIPLVPALIGALVIGGVYGCAVAILRKQLSSGARLQVPRDIVTLIAVAIASAGLVAFALVADYIAAGLVPWVDFLRAAFQLWIGDAIGIVVMAPLVLIIAANPPHRWAIWRKSWPTIWRESWPTLIETAAQWASILGALTVVFSYGQHQDSFKLFYFLFLPLVWVAARRGLTGSSWAVLTIQGGLIAALEFQDQPAAVVLTFQMLMFAVATTGLMLGAFVSERHRVAHALAASQSRLAAILDTARDGVLTVDETGHIESVNPAVEQLFARPARQLVGCNVGELITGAGLVQSLASTARLPPGEPTYRELAAHRANGELFPIELTVGRFGPPEGEHYTLVIRDISSRREMEALARLHQSEMAEVSKFALADEMTSALAHELRQPLTAISAFGRGCLRLLRQAPAQPELLQEGIEQVVDQAERAGEIIERLREFVRGGTSQRMAIEVSELVNAAIALIQIEAARHRIAVEAKIPSNLPAVMADRIQIEQVLLNLLRNAIEAISGAGMAPGAVVVEAREADQRRVEILVSDTGPGVMDETRAHLFEPFVTTKPQGMGLGLVISRSIMEAHQGRLRLARSGSNGAVFTFDLPAAEIETSSRAA